jgi:glutamyl-tRNA(Gln) amidotransferase subunit E
VAKEALPELTTWLCRNTGKNIQEAIQSLGLKMFSKEEIERIVDTAISSNAQLIQERGMGALGLLMGSVMKEVRGKAKAEQVSELIKRRLEQKSKR